MRLLQSAIQIYRLIVVALHVSTNFQLLLSKTASLQAQGVFSVSHPPLQVIILSMESLSHDVDCFFLEDKKMKLYAHFLTVVNLSDKP